MSRTALAVALIFVGMPACTTGAGGTNAVGSCMGGGARAPESSELGSVSSALTLDPQVHHVTISALDLDADRELTTSETYAQLDHGFTLELPLGFYDIELTDATGRMLARYPEVVVDGSVHLEAPTLQSPAAAEN